MNRLLTWRWPPSRSWRALCVGDAAAISELGFATLAVLAMFAVKTWLRRNDAMHPDHESEADCSEAERRARCLAEG